MLGIPPPPVRPSILLIPNFVQVIHNLVTPPGTRYTATTEQQFFFVSFIKQRPAKHNELFVQTIDKYPKVINIFMDASDL